VGHDIRGEKYTGLYVVPIAIDQQVDAGAADCRIRSICWMPDMQTKFVAANGLRLEVLEQGTGVRLALCLHGFPEHAIPWRHQIPVLAGMGWSLTSAAG
jgi:hypothetical protein